MQKYARVMIKGDHEIVMDFPIADGMDFPQFIAAIRAQGFIGPDGRTQCYVPLDQIKCIMQIEAANNVAPNITPLRPVS